MSMNIRFPNITGATEAEQLIQIKSYLHQLVQQLNWALSTFEAGIGSAGTSEPSMGDINEQTFYELKTLLIKSSDMLNGYYEKINQKLEGQYVLQSDFDTYKQSVSGLFTQLGNQYVSNQEFGSYQNLVDRNYVLKSAFDEVVQGWDTNFGNLPNEFVSRADFDLYKASTEQSIADLEQRLSNLEKRLGSATYE